MKDEYDWEENWTSFPTDWLYVNEPKSAKPSRKIKDFFETAETKYDAKYDETIGKNNSENNFKSIWISSV